ncbi:MAG: UDP-N-acetylmuramate--L-alanine ligase [Bacteroidota bacterium]
MKFEHLHNVYFLGIGGIGMSALARWFNQNGFQVAGYDRTPTVLTDRLVSEGIAVHFEDDPALISEAVRADREHSLVVYTPAIPKDHQEWAWLREQGYTIQKRAQVLGLISQGFFTVAIAGTHGKTTTSSMVAHLLRACGRDVAGFLGGITVNYDSNLLLNETQEAVVVAEADEFDRSFLHLHPNLAVVTACDADHLDIYGKASALHDSFREFVQQVDGQGRVFLQTRTQPILFPEGKDGAVAELYGIDAGELRAEKVLPVGDQFQFELVRGVENQGTFTLPMPGFHNVENAVAALGIGLELGLSADALREALASYRGVKRRFEYVVRTEDQIYIDDYAHHPTEIEALLKSVRALYPGRAITAIFQPHLFSRTRDFAEGFSASLSLADEVLLLPIYPARELPIAGVESEMLIPSITAEKQLVQKEEVLSVLAEKTRPVLLTVGAGDIDQLVQPIKAQLEA